MCSIAAAGIIPTTAAQTDIPYNYVTGRALYYNDVQEQVRHKRKLNIVSFDSVVRSWRPSVVEITESSLQDAWSWVKDLKCHGTTNTLAALQLAFKDAETQAVYLLTDGRPDHVRHVSFSYTLY